MKKAQIFIELHILLMMYSLGSVCSKAAGRAEFLSIQFIGLYVLVLLDLFFYALLWQQILKKMPLSVAYANKAVTVIWGMVWGILFFCEKISIYQAVGSLVIIIGIYLAVSADE